MKRARVLTRDGTVLAHAVWLAAVLTSLALTATSAIAAYSIRGYVIANGGDLTAGANNRIYGTVGQAAVGHDGGANNGLCQGFWCFGGSRVLAVGPPGGCGCDVPSELSLSRPFPNPSRDAVGFELALPKSGSAELAIFDVTGRKIDEMREPDLSAGHHRLTWHAPRGAAGLYFARFYVDHRLVGEHRIVLVR